MRNLRRYEFLMAAALGAASVLAEEREVTVSAASYGLSGGRNPALAETMVSRLPLGRPVRTRKTAPCGWLDIPSGGKAGHHLNLVELKCGQRQELLALLPGGGTEPLAGAARATALHGQEGRYLFAFTASPGDYQLPENAPADLVNNVGWLLANPPSWKGTVHLALYRLEKGKPPDPAAVMESSRQPADPFLAPYVPLAVAALAASGYQPAFTPLGTNVLIGLVQAEDGLGFEFRASLRVGGQEAFALERASLPPERLYDAMRLLFLNLLEWRGEVGEFGLAEGSLTNAPPPVAEAVAPEEAERLTARWLQRLDGALYRVNGLVLGCDEAGVLHALDAQGNERWAAPIGGGLADEPKPAGEGAIVAASHSNSVWLLDRESGKVLAVRTFKTWVRAVAPAGKDLYCIDLKNRLYRLDPKTLAVRRELAFPFPLRPAFWTDPGRAGVCLVDEKGFFYRCGEGAGEETR